MAALTGSAFLKRGLNAIDLFLRRWSNLALVLFGAAAFLLGLWGWRLDNPVAGFSGWVDDIFRTFQLLTLQFPHDASSPHWHSAWPVWTTRNTWCRIHSCTARRK